jgi:transposase
MNTTVVGLDLAKNVFQAHGTDANGKTTICRKLRRSEVLAFFANLPPCLVGMEACASAHYWAREIIALGHQVRLMPPKYVRPFVKRNKNDRADAEAICEAVQRPNMRFVPVKSELQQGALILHRTRELLVRQRTQIVNALRGHLAEFGIVAAQGTGSFPQLRRRLADPDDGKIPAIARTFLQRLVEQLDDTERKLKAINADLAAWAKSSDVCRRLMTIPGVGAVVATALEATIGDPAFFKSGRCFAAWLGLVPKQYSTGGKDRLGAITKAGNRYMRKLLIHGGRALLRFPRGRHAWLANLLTRRPANVAIVAQANKTARIAWAIMTYGSTYRATAAPVEASKCA